MKKLIHSLIPFALLASLVFASAAFSQESTVKIKIGVFNLFNARGLVSIHAQAVRAILTDDLLKVITAKLDSGIAPEEIFEINELKEINAAGIDVIITLRWPKAPDSYIDRVPQGDDRRQCLARLEKFLVAAGRYLTVVSVQNEYLAGPGIYEKKEYRMRVDGGSPVFDWFKEVAETVRALRQSRQDLAHLKIASPVWEGIDCFIPGAHHPLCDRRPYTKDVFFQTVAFSNEYCDYVDLHLWGDVSGKMSRMIEFAKQHTALPLITTEWSQVHGLDEWLKKPLDKGFRDKYTHVLSVNRWTTNKAFIAYCYRHRVSPEIWSDFAASVPHDPRYIADSYRLFQEKGFAYCFWALGYQYGEPVFDVKTLFANRVTADRHTPNQPVYDEFVSFLTALSKSPAE